MTNLPYAPFDEFTARRLLAGDDSGQAGVWGPGFRDGVAFASGNNGVHTTEPPNIDSPGVLAFDAGLRWVASTEQRIVHKTDVWPAPSILAPERMALISRAPGTRDRYWVEYAGATTEGAAMECLEAVISASTPSRKVLPPIAVFANGTLQRRFLEDGRIADRSGQGSLEARALCEWWDGKSGESFSLADTLAMVAVTSTDQASDARLSTWLDALGITHQGALTATVLSAVTTAMFPWYMTTESLPLSKAAKISWDQLMDHVEREGTKPDPFPLSRLSAARASRNLKAAETLLQRQVAHLQRDLTYVRRMHWSGDAVTGRIAAHANLSGTYVVQSASHLPPRIKLGRMVHVILGTQRYRAALSVVGSTEAGVELHMEGVGSPNAADAGLALRRAVSRAATEGVMAVITEDVPTVKSIDTLAERGMSTRKATGWFASRTVEPPRITRQVPMWVAAAAAGASAGAPGLHGQTT
jgi:hypothetical protein